ncbi:MAG: 3-keto-5-aminohexanoate cleavage protein, partial [Pseudomonadota bacterium]
MNNTPSLPQIMVAPNGARRNKSHHEAIPISHTELVETAIACQKAGADGIHLHIRDNNAEHLLDADAYSELLELVSTAVPDMYLQVTSEAAGKYSPAEQIEMMNALQPANVSVALRELVPNNDGWSAASKFYRWAAG